jgi:predicted metalloprotease
MRMRWEDGRRSDNVEDRRGMPVGPVAGGGIGLVIVALIAMFFGVDPRVILPLAPTQSSVPASGPPSARGQADPMKDFVSVVLADTEDTWSAIFRQAGAHYEVPKLVLFTGTVESACGLAQTAVGPFYCPGDHKVYIDLAFYRDLRERFHAPGEFAQAYVIAHEVGHHVQNLLGIAGKVHAAQQRSSAQKGNALSVRMELQADCLAGIWAHHANRSRHILEQGDVEAALNAASQIGDDRIQLRSRGYVAPESFTHGSGDQRVRWFSSGLQSGDLKSCDTFNAARL